MGLSKLRENLNIGLECLYIQLTSEECDKSVAISQLRGVRKSFLEYLEADENPRSARSWVSDAHVQSIVPVGPGRGQAAVTLVSKSRSGAVRCQEGRPPSAADPAGWRQQWPSQAIMKRLDAPTWPAEPSNPA